MALMAFCNSQHYAPFETGIEHEANYGIAKLLVSLLKVAGFKKNAKSAAWAEVKITREVHLAGGGGR